MADYRSAYFNLFDKLPTDVEEAEAEQYSSRLSGSLRERLAALAGWISGGAILGGVPTPRYGTIVPSGRKPLITDEALARLIARLKSNKPPESSFQRLMTSGPKTPTWRGSLSGIGEADRPWTEIYSAAETGGKKFTPPSYKNPVTVTLPDEDVGDALKKLLESLGGSAS